MCRALILTISELKRMLFYRKHRNSSTPFSITSKFS